MPINRPVFIYQCFAIFKLHRKLLHFQTNFSSYEVVETKRENANLLERGGVLHYLRFIFGVSSRDGSIKMYFSFSSRRQEFKETRNYLQCKGIKKIEKTESNRNKAKTNSCLPLLQRDNSVPTFLRSQNWSIQVLLKWIFLNWYLK